MSFNLEMKYYMMATYRHVLVMLNNCTLINTCKENVLKIIVSVMCTRKRATNHHYQNNTGRDYACTSRNVAIPAFGNETKDLLM